MSCQLMQFGHSILCICLQWCNRATTWHAACWHTWWTVSFFGPYLSSHDWSAPILVNKLLCSSAVMPTNICWLCVRCKHALQMYTDLSDNHFRPYCYSGSTVITASIAAAERQKSCNSPCNPAISYWVATSKTCLSIAKAMAPPRALDLQNSSVNAFENASHLWRHLWRHLWQHLWRQERLSLLICSHQLWCGLRV